MTGQPWAETSSQPLLQALGQPLSQEPCQQLPQAPDQRVSFLLCDLLLRDAWVTVDGLCARLYVSRGTVTGDLKQVERVVGAYGLGLERRPYRGVRVRGPERLRRLCLARLADHADKSQGAMLSTFYQAVDAVLGCGCGTAGEKTTAPDAMAQAEAEKRALASATASHRWATLPSTGSLPGESEHGGADEGASAWASIARGLDAVLAREGVRVYAALRRPLTVRVAIALARVRLGRCLGEDDAAAEGRAESAAADAEGRPAGAHSDEAPAPDPRHDVPAGTPARAPARAVRDLGRALGFSLPPAEIAALATCLTAAQLAEDIQPEDIPADAVALSHAMLEAMWRAFRFDFRADEDLVRRLSQHAGPLLARRLCGMELDSPFAADMPARCPLAWALAQVAASALTEPSFAAYAPLAAQRLPVVSVGETAQLALLFAMALERQRAEAPRRNVAVVSALGGAEAGLVVHALRRDFGAYVGTITLCGVFDAEDLDFSDIDYAFAAASVRDAVPVPVLDTAAVLDVSRAEEVRAFLRGDAGGDSDVPALNVCLQIGPLKAGDKNAALRALVAQGAEAGMLTASVARKDADAAGLGGRAPCGSVRIGSQTALAYFGRPGCSAALVVGALEQPLAWDVGGPAVQLVALLQSPERSTHAFRAFLARLCRLLADNRAVARLRADPRQETLTRLLQRARA